MKQVLRTTISAAVLVAACASASAQTIDQFDVRREGNNAVLQLRFATEIQFQRSFATGSGDLTLIFYSLVTTTNAELRAAQDMALGSAQGLPRLTLADESDRGPRSRKLVLRTMDRSRVSVRAGQGNRSIEIIFLAPDRRTIVSRVAAQIERDALIGASPCMT